MRDLLILVLAVGVGGLMIAALWSQRGKARGLVNGRLDRVGPRPNVVCSEPDTPGDVHVQPIRASLADARAAVERMGGTIITETDDYLAATFQSRLFRFIDDLELRDAGDGTLHVRSGSRVGYSDMGANRKRVEALRAELSRGELSREG